MSRLLAFAVALTFVLSLLPAQSTVVVVERDDVVIDRSCTVRIPSDAVIEDTRGDGVIQIAASNVVVTFEDGSLLRGAPRDAPPEAMRGIGVALGGHENVTLRGLRVSGFRAGVDARNCDGLTLDDCRADDMFRQRLASTPRSEDASDWLWPHENDGGQWLERYGAAFAVTRARGVTVRSSRVRRTQNGLILDRVTNARVYDNDFSFLSGWGVALWRCSGNVVTRNALDFCVRGYSHGVYNRGQDSAGILMFEQCSRNVVAENSATHGGDGFFGFAGKEALGETPPPRADFAYARRGNDDNVIADNDFSFAVAHGIEMTFSFGNVLARNRLVGCGICGVWGGYSQETLIAGNLFAGNGAMAYGLERGGVNIEHGRGNRILANRFTDDRCGVHLWWDRDAGLSATPWARANLPSSSGETVAGNRFVGSEVAIHLRRTLGARIAANEYSDCGVAVRGEEATVAGSEPAPAAPIPAYPVYGVRRPVGARAGLGGRDAIIMGEYGPWDHESFFVRSIERAPGRHVYELLGDPNAQAHVVTAAGCRVRREGKRLVVSSKKQGVHPYRIAFPSGDAVIDDALFVARWRVRFFATPEDPRGDAAGWRSMAAGDQVALELEALRLRFGSNGPAKVAADVAAGVRRRLENLGADHFGMIAETEVALPSGRFEIATTSDDGIRVLVDGKAVIEDWTWHAPKRHRAVIDRPDAGVAHLRVEYFELDGWAICEVDVRPIGG